MSSDTWAMHWKEGSRYDGQHRELACSDEIYANSIFRQDQQPRFTSMLKLAQEHGAELGLLPTDNLHIVFGLSKDWCVLSPGPWW